MHRRAFPEVQHLELNTRFIRAPRHFAAQGVEFADKMALAGASDRWVARHIADSVKIDRKTYSFRAQARGGKRGLDPGVPRAYDRYIELPCLKVNHIS